MNKKILIFIACITIISLLVACSDNEMIENEGNNIVQDDLTNGNVDKPNEVNEDYFILNEEQESALEISKLNFNKSLVYDGKHGAITTNEMGTEVTWLGGNIPVKGFEGKAESVVLIASQLAAYSDIAILNDKGEVFINTFDNYPVGDADDTFRPSELHVRKLDIPQEVVGIDVVEFIGDDVLEFEIVLKLADGDYATMRKIENVL